MIVSVAGTSALITDIDRRKALPIIRSLGRDGVKIIGISYNRFPRHSRSIVRRFIGVQTIVISQICF